MLFNKKEIEKIAQESAEKINKEIGIDNAKKELEKLLEENKEK